MILFYGCWTSPDGHSDTGHYFRAKNGDRLSSGQRWRTLESLVPWGLKVDGFLAPRTTNGAQAVNGIVGYHQAISWVDCPGEEAWSLISWWDNSVDDRPGSNCAFMVNRRASLREILAEARDAFPQIFLRFKYPIVLPASTQQ